MIVVADTTPLNYLILIGEVDVLPIISQPQHHDTRAKLLTYSQTGYSPKLGAQRPTSPATTVDQLCDRLQHAVHLWSVAFSTDERNAYL